MENENTGSVKCARCHFYQQYHIIDGIFPVPVENGFCMRKQRSLKPTGTCGDFMAQGTPRTLRQICSQKDSDDGKAAER